jgi:hypothetical protein
MDRETLFTGAPASAELARNPEESPSPLAVYTLSQMVGDLAAVRADYTPGSEETDATVTATMRERYADLQAKHEATLADTEGRIRANADPAAARITQLDLAFMLGSYLPDSANGNIRSFDFVPPKLNELLELQASRFGLPPYMDYDLVIDANTEEFLKRGHVRTFTGDPHERDFYIGHHLCEPYIRDVAGRLRTLVEDPARPDMAEILEGAASNMATFRSYMQRYISLSRPVFDRMRPYLISYPDGTRNASGAFMPGVPLAELAQRPVTDEQARFLDTATPYYPRWARDTIAGWRQDSAEGQNVMDLIENGKIALDERGRVAWTRVCEEFVRFRMAHHAATRKQIPGAFPPDAAVSRAALRTFGEPDITGADHENGVRGTADFDVQRLLGGTVHRSLVVLDHSQAVKPS